NTQDGISLVQTAEGSLTEVQSMLQRTRELAVQYQNGTLGASDRDAINSEVTQLTDEIERIGRTSTFNGISLLSVDRNTITFQVGANDGETITVGTISLQTVIGTRGTFCLSDRAVLSAIDSAIDQTSAQRATFGAVENRLQHTYNNLQTYEENLTASNSRITDVDMASEMVNFTKNQVLEQAGTAMLSQAQQEPQNILSLLR
ncbi:MAG TPA: flagellin, partial [Conexibacter sp.]